MDPFTEEFWRSICFEEETVSKAVEDALACLNREQIEPDDLFRLYGNGDYKLR